MEPSTQPSLSRSTSDVVIAGICSGIAKFFKVDVNLVRALFVFLVLFGGFGSGLYLVLWLFLPADNASSTGGDVISNNVKHMQDTAMQLWSSPEKAQARQVMGLILIGIGVIYFCSGFFVFGLNLNIISLMINSFVPAVLALAGVVLLAKK